MVVDRNENGQFTLEHTDAQVLAAVRTHEPAATSEVADELGMTRQGADQRLRQLRDGGLVNSKKIGASLVWFDPAVPGAESSHGETGDARGGVETEIEDSPLAGEELPENNVETARVSLDERPGDSTEDDR